MAIMDIWNVTTVRCSVEKESAQWVYPWALCLQVEGADSSGNAAIAWQCACLSNILKWKEIVSRPDRNLLSVVPYLLDGEMYLPVERACFQELYDRTAQCGTGRLRRNIESKGGGPIRDLIIPLQIWNVEEWNCLTLKGKLNVVRYFREI